MKNNHTLVISLSAWNIVLCDSGQANCCNKQPNPFQGLMQQNSTSISSKKSPSILDEQPSCDDSGTQVVFILWLPDPEEHSHSRWGRGKTCTQGLKWCTSLHSHPIGQQQVTGYSDQLAWLPNTVYLHAQGRNKADLKSNQPVFPDNL